jgi:hypothetical protein
MKNIRNNAFKIMLGAVLSPFVFGFVTQIFCEDFSAGAGLGVFVIIGAFILIFVSLITERKL